MKRTIYITVILLFFFFQNDAQVIIQGNVTDITNNQPAIGAFISVKTLNVYSVTDVDGSFELVLPTPSELKSLVLTVSSMGYRTLNEVLEIQPIDDGETITKILKIEPDPLTLKDVIVTANKVEEELQNVPLAATVISAENLKNRSISDTDEALEMVPNLVYDEFEPSRAIVSVRGLSSDFINLGAENSVGLYIDEVFYSRLTDFNSSLIDIERVEVLRGPQGTLYGKNTIGGLIHIHSEKPKMGNFGSVELSSGNFNYLRARLKGNVELIDNKLAVRLAGSYRKRDGWMLEDNPALKDENGILFYGGRLSLLYRPSERFSFLLRGSYSRDAKTTFTSDYKIAPFGNILGVPDEYTDPYDRRLSQNENAVEFDREQYSAVGRFDVKLDRVHTLTSISSYTFSDIINLRDLDATPVDATINGGILSIENLTQELRISTPRENRKFFYVVGAYFLRETFENNNLLGLRKGAQPAIEFTLGVPFGSLSFIPENYFEDVNSFNINKSTSLAGFFSGSYEISERVRLNGGVRLTYEDKQIEAWREITTNFESFPNGFASFPVASEAEPLIRDTTVTIFSGNVGMEFRTTDNTLLYVNYSRGFKGPGYNVTFSQASPIFVFRPEFINSYEFGIKLKHENRFLFNAAVFVNNFQNKQESVAVGADIFVSNAKAVEGQGIELEFTGIWNRFLKTDIALGALHMKYTDFPFLNPDTQDPNDLINLSGNRAFKSPGFTFKFTPELYLPLGRELKMLIRADYDFVGKVYNDIFNTEDLKREAAGRLNARIGFMTKNERYEIALWGRNLTDEVYFIHASRFNVGDIVTVNAPRLLGIDLKANILK